MHADLYAAFLPRSHDLHADFMPPFTHAEGKQERERIKGSFRYHARINWAIKQNAPKNTPPVEMHEIEKAPYILWRRE